MKQLPPIINPLINGDKPFLAGLLTVSFFTGFVSATTSGVSFFSATFLDVVLNRASNLAYFSPFL